MESISVWLRPVAQGAVHVCRAQVCIRVRAVCGGRGRCAVTSQLRAPSVPQGLCTRLAQRHTGRKVGEVGGTVLSHTCAHVRCGQSRLTAFVVHSVRLGHAGMATRSALRCRARVRAQV